ncbi:MAG TPA: FAD-binding oxidoreductase [Aestuariivirga sp.]|nr:FAD-binding oxidoreductase [Aestuariivirga sp.]
MKQGVNTFPTWYEATTTRGEMRMPLRGEVKADVCVIGGGLAGLTTALELSRRKKKVVLLEAKQLAWGASGRNGGFVSNGFAEGIENVQKRVGLEAARALYSLSRHGTEYVRREIEAGDPAIKMGEGWVVALRHRDKGDLKSYRDMMARDYGEDLQFLSAEQTRERLNSARYFESKLDPSAFHFHPLRYSLMMARKAEKNGARICESSPALSVQKQDAAWRVKTSGGEVLAQHVVHCVSSLDRTIHKASGRAVLPVATYIAVTEPLTQEVVRTSAAISDSRRAGNYYRLIDEGRLLWGGRITTRVSEPARLAEEMKGDMLATYPQLGNPRIDYSWAGLMGYALHKMPLIGRDDEGQWFATAFGGHGMNTTAMTGQLLGRAIADGDDEYRRFAAFAPLWAGGQLGRAGVQASYWWMQLRDRIDEARAR